MISLVTVVACTPRHGVRAQPSPGPRQASPARSSDDVRAREQPDQTGAEPPVEPAVVRHLRGINVLKSHNEEMYPDDGPVPKVDTAYVNLETTDGRSHSVKVKRIAVVLDNCADPKRTDVRVRTVRGVELHSWKDLKPIATGKATLTTPAGTPRQLSMRISFDGIETYSACGLAIDLVVDQQPVRLDLPLAIVLKRNWSSE